MTEGFSITTTGITLTGLGAAIAGVWGFLVHPMQKQLDKIELGKADISLCAEKHKNINQNFTDIKADLKEVKEGINDIALLLAKEQKGN